MKYLGMDAAMAEVDRLRSACEASGYVEAVEFIDSHRQELARLVVELGGKFHSFVFDPFVYPFV